MRKQVVPFRPGHFGEVFVRMLADGAGQSSAEGPWRVRLTHASPHSSPREVWMDECDVVAMVTDDSRYAFADGPGLEYCQNTDPGAWPQGAEPFDHARGTGLKFKTPEDAARALTALGWSVTPPGVERRVDLTENGVRVAVKATHEGRTASLVLSSDAHAEPIGVADGRFIARRRSVGPRWFVYDTLSRAFFGDGYKHEHLAQAECDDRNLELNDR